METLGGNSNSNNPLADALGDYETGRVVKMNDLGRFNPAWKLEKIYYLGGGRHPHDEVFHPDSYAEGVEDGNTSWFSPVYHKASVNCNAFSQFFTEAYLETPNETLRPVAPKVRAILQHGYDQRFEKEGTLFKGTLTRHLYGKFLERKLGGMFRSGRVAETKIMSDSGLGGDGVNDLAVDPQKKTDYDHNKIVNSSTSATTASVSDAATAAAPVPVSVPAAKPPAAPTVTESPPIQIKIPPKGIKKVESGFGEDDADDGDADPNNGDDAKKSKSGTSGNKAEDGNSTDGDDKDSDAFSKSQDQTKSLNNIKKNFKETQQ